MDASTSVFSAADEETWKILQEAFHQIAGYTRSGFPDRIAVLIQGYTLCFNISHCDLKKAVELFRRAQKMVEDYLDEVTRTLFETGAEGQARTGVDLLFILCDQWQSHQVLAKWCEKTFRHLDILRDRSLIKGQDSVYNMLLKCFASAGYGRVKHAFVEAILAEIDKDRNGAVASCGAVKVGTTMLVELGLGEKGKEETTLYREDFQKAFLEATRVYYRRACAEILHQEGGRR
eukprot:RCo008571